MVLINIFHSGGLFIISLLLLLTSAWSFYRAYRSHNSNSTRNDNSGFHDNQGNVPYTQIGSFWFGVILALAAVVSFFMIGADYRGV